MSYIPNPHPAASYAKAEAYFKALDYDGAIRHCELGKTQINPQTAFVGRKLETLYNKSLGCIKSLAKNYYIPTLRSASKENKKFKHIILFEEWYNKYKKYLDLADQKEFENAFKSLDKNNWDWLQKLIPSVIVCVILFIIAASITFLLQQRSFAQEPTISTSTPIVTPSIITVGGIPTTTQPTPTLTPTDEPVSPTPTSTEMPTPPMEVPNPSPTEIIIRKGVITENVRLRSGPDSNQSLTGLLGPGAKVDILRVEPSSNKANDRCPDYEWYFIRLPNGMETYVCAHFVRLLY